MNWDLFFEDLTYLDDVQYFLFREPLYLELEIKVLYIFVFMVLDIQL